MDKDDAKKKAESKSESDKLNDLKAEKVKDEAAKEKVMSLFLHP